MKEQAEAQTGKEGGVKGITQYKPLYIICYLYVVHTMLSIDMFVKLINLYIYLYIFLYKYLFIYLYI